MLADDMRRLAEEISNAYEERIKGVVAMKTADAERKHDTQEDLKQIANQLRADLDQFSSDMEAAEADRKSTTQAELSEMANQLRAKLDQFKSNLDDAEADRKEENQEEIAERRNYITDLREKAQDLLKEFDQVHEEMAKQLRAFLDQFKSNLDDAEAERKEEDQEEIAERRNYITDLREKAQDLLKEFDQVHEEMAKQLRARLVSFSGDLTASVAGLMGEFEKDRTEAAKAWNDILSSIRSAEKKTVITGPAEVVAAVEVTTVEEAIETETPEEEEEDIENKIIGLLQDQPDGLRMVEIADILSVENWRSLIPLMKQLLEDREVTKVDSTYYAA